MSSYGPSSGASFAAGFAQGFSDTYMSLTQQKRKEEADLVKFNMERFVRERDKFIAAEKADALKVDAAKKFAAANGLPADAWGNLYNDLSMGITPNQVQVKIENGSYKKIGNSTSNVVTTEGDLSSVDARTSSQTDALLETSTERKDKPADVKVPGENLFQKVSGGMAELFDKDKRAQKREERVLAETLRKLDIEQSEYDRILSGYQSESPEISYVYSANKDPSKQPKWKSFGNITTANYIAMAAEARAANDEDQAVAITNLGQLMKNEEADFQDFGKLTSKNANGHLMAAQAAGYPEVAEKIKEWMSNPANIDPADVPNYKKYELAVSPEKTRAMIFAARQAGDEEAVDALLTRLEEIDERYPDQIDKNYIQSEYVRLSLAANGENAAESDKVAFQNFKNNTLPTFMEIYKRINPSEQPLDFEAAWNSYYRIKSDPNTSQEEKDNALRVANGAIVGMAMKENIEANAGKRVSLVKINEDGTADFITSATSSFDAEGRTIYTDGYGQSVPAGYRVVPKDEDESREKTINTLSTRVKTYDGNFVTATGAVRLYSELADMVMEDDRVLFATSGTAKSASNALKEIKNGLNLIGSIFEANQNGEIPEEITQEMVERRLQQQGILQRGQSLEQAANIESFTLGDTVEDLAKKKAAFNAKIILMAFRAGGLEGQTGMAMSNKDFERLKEVVNASKDGETFVVELGKYVQGRIDTLQDDASLLKNDRGRVNFQQRYGYDPYLGKSPIKEWSSLTEEGAEIDPLLQRGLDILAGDYEFGGKKDTPSIPVITSQEEYDALPSGTKYQFTDKNGQLQSSTKR